MVGLEKKYRAAEDANTTRHGEKVRRPRRNRFPLVKDDDDPSSVFWVADGTEEEEEVSENVNDDSEEEEYIPRRRPPLKSPVGAPPSSEVHTCPLSHSSSIHHEPAPTRNQSQENTAKLDVQDALLAIRLCGFLKAQGVSEVERNVAFDESDDEEEGDETMAAEIDCALAKMHAASAVAASASAAKNRNPTLVLAETSATPKEEGMHALPLLPCPRPCPAVEERPLRSSPSPLVLNIPASRNVSGGRTTSSSPPPSAAYMIAVLTMWHRYASGRCWLWEWHCLERVFSHGVRDVAEEQCSVARVAPLDEDTGDADDSRAGG